jgi:hypothetical protein
LVAMVGLRLCLLALVVWGVHWASLWLLEALELHVRFDVSGDRSSVSMALLALAVGIYVVVLALPFVPAAECGMLVLVLFGAEAAPLVYLGTVAGLLLAFGIGRLVPAPRVAWLLRRIWLERAAVFVEETASLSPQDRIDRIVATRAKISGAWLLRNRYVALMLAINLPGSFLIGGGGGIAMAAGMSRLFAPLPFVLAVCVAVVPVPLLFFLFAG